jgi:hypothetical protein
MTEKQKEIKNKYNLFIKETKKNKEQKFLYVDGFQRTGTNFFRNMFLSEKINEFFYLSNFSDDLIVYLPSQHETHNCSYYDYFDSHIHNANVFHILPIRNIRKNIISYLIMTNQENANSEKEIDNLCDELKNLEDFLKLAINKNNKYKNLIVFDLDQFLINPIKSMDNFIIFMKINKNINYSYDNFYSRYFKENNEINLQDEGKTRNSPIPVDNAHRQDLFNRATQVLENPKLKNQILILESLYEQAKLNCISLQN